MTSRLRHEEHGEHEDRPRRIRKPPQERRAEIVRTAARVALAEGLELITLRRIAEELGVRPSLIGHYFPAADDLVAEAFTHAATVERDSLLPHTEQPLPPLDRLALFLVRLTGGDYDDLSRLWLNARHLSRFKEPLRRALAAQEALNRGALAALIEEGGLAAQDPLRAALHILMAVDGMGTYSNTGTGEGEPLPGGLLVGELVLETAESRLGLAPGTLRERARANGVG
ncbi:MULTISPECIES: TetR/AcrR family transcriptional regulator [Streptomyces]|uniref:TetR/AcrR family transcriptional regulator n=1 Tax=Streptomyces TaxID=1883 RepID=UPI0006B68103|nr:MULTISPECIES: TetR family transcriptional regulator [Streptomyces]KPC91258.1 TetR family transcriptional regulator [Streptomyces sp. NRRL F-6602]MDI6410075.1 TetR family transcriptional regulator [Streptomyces albus]